LRADRSTRDEARLVRAAPPPAAAAAEPRGLIGSALSGALSCMHLR
jgi:hypothetical protein